jgi:hypothetical protein
MGLDSDPAAVILRSRGPFRDALISRSGWSVAEMIGPIPAIHA